MQWHNISAPRGEMLYRSSRLHHLAEFGDTYPISYLLQLSAIGGLKPYLSQAAPLGIMACVSGIHSLHNRNSVDEVRDYSDVN